jgi:DNA-binding transcriptional LysR family regulator
MSPGTTLEQWLVLQTVVEQGSYVRAAEQLCRSQSSVSYALSALQERLGIELLHIQGRKAELTDAGRQMLAQAQPLLAGFRQLETRAASLKAGVRTSIALVVDLVFPKSQLLTGLLQFQQAWPQVQVHVTEVLRTESDSALAGQDAELYVTTHQPSPDSSPLLDVDFVALAHAAHPLHQLDGPLSATQLEQYPLVMMADRVVQRTQMRSERSVWSFTTIEAAVEAICHGVGYGWLPLHRVSALLANGQLKRLPLASGQVRKTSLYLVFGDDSLYFDPTVVALADSLRHAI